MSSSDQRRLHVVIPARYSSGRLPGKPLIDLAGKPMIVRVYERVVASIEAEVVVATDDVRIVAVLESRGIPSVMTSVSCASGTDRIAEVADRLGWLSDELVLNVQGDEPLIDGNLLREFVRMIHANDIEMATVAVAAAPSDIVDPNAVKVTVDSRGRAIAFSRSPIPMSRSGLSSDADYSQYLRHVGLYAYRVDALRLVTEEPPCWIEQMEQLEQLRAQWLGIPITVLRWGGASPAGVDTAEDVVRVAGILEAEVFDGE